ncbi:MAG TPA: hypothetical protein VH853_06700 [Polyangia bacterium]|jgi:hypothetical protein|nr:hypothetical protein [Polyangia bacterium]
MRRAAWWAWTGAAALVVAGCGGAASSGTGGSTGASGGSGQGGGAAVNGVGGAAGSRGTGGSLGAGGSGAGAGLPACTIVQRPGDPMNPSSLNYIDPTNGTCNTIPLDAPSVTSGALDTVDGGALEDGGAIEAPAGGTILDGDYDLTHWLDEAGDTSIRTIRVFGGGTYIEWAESHVFDSGLLDAGYVNIWYDTTVQSSGQTLNLVSYDCGGDVLITSYGFTARGDDLILFAYNLSGTSQALYSVDTYHRTCTRP